MNILIWLAVGAIAGWLAGLVMKGGSFGLVGNIIIGILGAFLGGWIAGKLNIAGAEVGTFSVPGILTALGGSVVLLFLISLIKKAK